MDPYTINWKPLLSSWLRCGGFEWQEGYEENFTTLFDWIIPPCLEYVKSDCQQLCKINELSLVKTTIQVLEMLLIEAYDAIQKKEEDVKNLSSWIQASFIQAVIWGVGSNLDLNSRAKFDEFFKQLWRGQNKSHPYPKLLEKVEVGVPVEEMIFDHSYFYKSKGNWKFWPDALKNEKIEESDYLTDTFVPTNESIKYTTLINMHITYNYPVLLVGPSGTGKSLCMLDVMMNKLDKEKYEATFLTFTPRVTASQTQELILSKLFKKKTGRFGPSEGKTCILYIDDLSESSRDVSGTQPALELVRELFDHKKWFNRENFKPLYVDDINVLSTMTATSRNQETCQRLLRHFNVFSINQLPEESIMRIFSNVLLTKWKKIGFPSDIIGTINQIVAATYHFYKSVSNLRPTLSWNFYYFNMRNFSRIIQVCAMIKKESADTNKKLFFKLWTHEMLRIFGDRLLEKDKNWFFDNIKFCINEYLKEELVNLFENLPKDDNMEPDLSKILFGTYTDKNSCRFDETDIEKLQEIASTCLKEYNKVNSNKIDLVLFDHALEHLSKICRIISIPCCNLIQVGMCGTGRQTLVRLACIIYEQKFFKLEITEHYNSTDWHNTVKAFLKEAGGLGKPCTFFLKEEQMVNNLILDDLDYLLKTGQIPFLYSLEEKQEILDLVRMSMQDENPNIDGGSESIFLYHQKRCKENLHVILSFNPINDKFMKYLRLHCSLRSFCEIIYLKKWPRESLESIARVWIEDLKISKEIKSKVVIASSYFHNEVEKISDGVHITLGSYLEFIRLYVHLVIFKQKKIMDVKQRYLAALEKLSFAAFQISEMQKSLADYQPQLEAMTVQAIEMAKQIEKETNEVEKASDLVKKDEEIANEQAAAAQVLKLDCEADLAQAIPILEDAISALNTLKPTDITLVKSMKNPPDAIKLVMAAVCVIKDVKPDRIPDPSTGRKTIDYWGPSKRILGDMNFLQTLKDFDKDNIKPEIMVKIRKDYLPHKDFKPHTVAKASSAAEGLCKWIIAMDMYDKVAKEVAPKKEKLEKAEREYGTTMAILNEKKEQVSRIEQKLADLNELLKEATRKQQKLQRDVDICKKKLNRAQKLIGGLSEEKSRWTNAVDQLEKQYDRLAGDILLSTAVIAYLGPFRADNRHKTLSEWLSSVSQNGIPFKEKYDFVEAFEKDLDFDKWHLNGLPTDRFFIENGIIGTMSKRWSLYIDPQNQANMWIKISEKQNGIKVTKFTCQDYLTVMKDCITSGTPLLLENVGESVEPFLMTLITRTTFFRNGAEYLNLGGQEVPYDKNFLLYMTTNMKYPHYSPEMFDKITIIDFSMNREALEEHLLTCVVEVEKPTLKKIKKTVNTQRKRNKDALYNIEERILKTLSESKTDILEDEQALQILDESKILSKEIQEKQEALKDTELILKEFRSGYETIAKHSTTLYFTTFELTKINHMYQFSYNWFVETYSESIQKAEKFKELPRRRKSLMETITYELYCKISRSIFEKDKLFFSFLLCTNLLLAERKISLDEIQFFAKSWGKSEQDQPCPEWLPPKRWRSICNLHNLTSYSNFTRFFLDNETKFREIYNSKNPETEPFPEPFNSSFNKLLIISLIRPDRLYKGIHNFVAQELGTKFVNPPSFDIATSFIESHILSPLIFILKPGSDPVKSLVNFARTKHFHNKLTLMSIKNGQEEYVEASTSEGKNLGLWICLQNCHLLTNWLPFLDLKLEEVDYSNTHENFRLWLTTNECQDFPISLLERSVKITKEPPKGLRNKLINLFQDDPVSCPKFYANCPGKQEAFVRLLYSLAFFHCILQERQNFGSYGWNVSYGFNKNDFFISIHELQSIVNNRLDPLEEIVYLLEKCSYGGYVRDAMDNRLLGVIVRNYINPRVLQNNCDTNFVNGLPTKTDHQDCINHILKLPETDDCEIFGLNENFESIKGLRESKPLLKSIQVTFNDIIYAKVLTNPAPLIQDLLQQLPPEFVFNKENEKTKDGIINLITLKEKKSYNKLIKTIRTSLTDLQEVVDGRLLMTEELEELAKSLVANQIPEIWMRKAYVNSFCLTSFVEDLIARIDYFKNLSCSPEETIWLASFFNPKAFLTANKLLYSKKYSVLMDDVHFCLKNNTEGLNSEGFVLVNGLHLVGARWNEESECLDELPAKILHEALPPVSFVFTIDKQRNMYECPLYKSINNFHDESFSENSSNFVASVLLNTGKCSEYWIKRGTALLCQI
jgi:dynein heavy chain